jgi:hypothetical protein
MNSLAAARPDMIATLDSFRHTLEVSEAHSASLIQFQLALNVKVPSVNPGGAQVSGWSSRHYAVVRSGVQERAAPGQPRSTSGKR